MVFNGIEPAPPLEIAPCGLLSVARVVKHTDGDDHWVNKFTAELDGTPTVTILTNLGADSTNYSAPAPGAVNYSEVLPFWVELTVTQTSVDFKRDGFDQKYIKQLEAASQKAAEYELWEGVATRGNTVPVDDNYLIKSGGATVVTTAGATPEKALALIEQSISNSPTGGRGIIHMTRDVASALGSRLRYFEKNVIDEKTYAVTRLGTLVVIGSGYTGNGPIGATGRAASATNKWMFVTGAVEVHLGEAEFTTKDPAQAARPSVNDFEIQVLRPVAVHFDPSIYYAAQVTLP